MSARDKQSLILLMFLRWKKQALQILVTCLASDMCSSKITPMILAEGDGLIRSPDTSTHSIDGGGPADVVRLRSITPSFLCSFSTYCTTSTSRSRKHASILAIAPGCSAGVGLNER